ncbi:MAG TPA: type II toxin-antitoxin system RelE/ParE family toxin [Acidobacteriaceae bacterium]|nr:type II toxin-antitoxin system RelE/ParE family toxin [Acidobacteriaceae bacterium]
MQIRWTFNAAEDMEHIWDYLRAHHPEFAERTVRKVYDEIRTLAQTPRLGRIGRESGTRELVISGLPYIAVYRVKDETVEVLHIFHGAQDRS